MSEYLVRETPNESPDPNLARYMVVGTESIKIIWVIDGGNKSSRAAKATIFLAGDLNNPSHEFIERPPIRDQEELIRAVGDFAVFVDRREHPER